MTFASPFKDRQVLVSGGTSGIGAGIAHAFLQAGAQVTLTGATAPEVDRARSDPLLAQANVRLLDVRQADQVQACVAQFQQLDVLINCAGVIRRGQEHDPDVFAQVMEINVQGTMRLCTAARGLLAQSRGCIINTASMLSFFGGGLVPAYSASKGAVAQLTKSLAIAYAPNGVRVNAIAPGWIATPLTQALQDDASRSAVILGRTPMARWGTPADVAGPVLFLASPAAAFVTGVILPVDGGYLIT
jgi:NAD(P)-dependent dehydrogenase (short-subunit alcohol dehydrogenase family)